LTREEETFDREQQESTATELKEYEQLLQADEEEEELFMSESVGQVNDAPSIDEVVHQERASPSKLLNEQEEGTSLKVTDKVEPELHADQIIKHTTLSDEKSITDLSQNSIQQLSLMELKEEIILEPKSEVEMDNHSFPSMANESSNDEHLEMSEETDSRQVEDESKQEELKIEKQQEPEFSEEEEEEEDKSSPLTETVDLSYTDTTEIEMPEYTNRSQVKEEEQETNLIQQQLSLEQPEEKIPVIEETLMQYPNLSEVNEGMCQVIPEDRTMVVLGMDTMAAMEDCGKMPPELMPRVDSLHHSGGTNAFLDQPEEIPSVMLEASIPPESHLVVSEAACSAEAVPIEQLELDASEYESSPVVLSGKMTLSVVGMDLPTEIESPEVLSTTTAEVPRVHFPADPTDKIFLIPTETEEEEFIFDSRPTDVQVEEDEELVETSLPYRPPTPPLQQMEREAIAPEETEEFLTYDQLQVLEELETRYDAQNNQLQWQPSENELNQQIDKEMQESQGIDAIVDDRSLENTQVSDESWMPTVQNMVDTILAEAIVDSVLGGACDISYAIDTVEEEELDSSELQQQVEESFTQTPVTDIGFEISKSESSSIGDEISSPSYQVEEEEILAVTDNRQEILDPVSIDMNSQAQYQENQEETLAAEPQKDDYEFQPEVESSPQILVTDDQHKNLKSEPAMRNESYQEEEEETPAYEPQEEDYERNMEVEEMEHALEQVEVKSTSNGDYQPGIVEPKISEIVIREDFVDEEEVQGGASQAAVKERSVADQNLMTEQEILQARHEIEEIKKLLADVSTGVIQQQTDALSQLDHVRIYSAFRTTALYYLPQCLMMPCKCGIEIVALINKKIVRFIIHKSLII